MKSILVIDDEIQVRMMLRQMLEREGYEVIDAPNGKVALTLIKEKPVDLVITDLIMPEKEGLETIMELKRNYSDLDIIAISGGGRIKPEEYLSFAQRLGAVYTFKKPVSRLELLEAVRELTQ
jgi:CheY-like chemotaxis protein